MYIQVLTVVGNLRLMVPIILKYKYLKSYSPVIVFNLKIYTEALNGYSIRREFSAKCSGFRKSQIYN